MANDKRRGTVKLSQYNEQAQVAPSATRDRSIVVGFYNAEGTAPVHPGCFTPAEADAFIAAINAALGRPSTPLADRIASEQTPPVDLSGICSEGREEEVYGLGYARGRADAAAMAREAGPTVPRGALAPVLALHAQIAEESGEYRANLIEALLTALDAVRADLAPAPTEGR